MRLIDADDLKKTYYRELNIEPGETGACYIAFGMFPRMIDNAKTINAEPKTGRWTTEHGDHVHAELRPIYIYCSECGMVSTVMWNYCPNCGAKMDGEI